MWKSAEGSTARLIQLCVAYFFFYVITGITVKYFEGAQPLFPGMDGITFLVYSTTGGTGICLAVVLWRGWWRVKSNGLVTVKGLSFPRELLYIVPSGICTAVVIPTTTLMYSFTGVSVMVAMVMMRGSVIVISRVVDAAQIRMGILKKKVYLIEDLAVALALIAVAVEPVFGHDDGRPSFLTLPAARWTFGSYIIAYAVRIFIMNYYKNTRGHGVKLDNQGFFGIEQLTAVVVLGLTAGVIFATPAEVPQLIAFHAAIATPAPLWPWAILAGTAFGMVAFFSVFIFMFKGRTATFAGLVNRLTSLIAGTTATLLFGLAFGGRLPQTKDWISLCFILAAVGFLTVAERRRAAELAAQLAAEA